MSDGSPLCAWDPVGPALRAPQRPRGLPGSWGRSEGASAPETGAGDRLPASLRELADRGSSGLNAKGPHRSQERCGPEWPTGRPTDVSGHSSPAGCWQVNTPPAKTPVLVTRGSRTPRALRGSFRHAELCSRRSAAGECCDCGAWRKEHRSLPASGATLCQTGSCWGGSSVHLHPRTRELRAAPVLYRVKPAPTASFTTRSPDVSSKVPGLRYCERSWPWAPRSQGVEARGTRLDRAPFRAL